MKYLLFISVITGIAGAQQPQSSIINLIAPTLSEIPATLEKLPNSGNSLIINYTPLAAPTARASRSPTFSFSYSVRQIFNSYLRTVQGGITPKKLLITTGIMYVVLNGYCCKCTRTLQRSSCWSLWKKRINTQYTLAEHETALVQELIRRYPDKTALERIEQLEQDCCEEMNHLHHYRSIASILQHANMLQTFLGALIWYVGTVMTSPLARFTFFFSNWYSNPWIHKTFSSLSLFSCIPSLRFFWIDEKIVDALDERVEHLQVMSQLARRMREKYV